MPVEWNREWGEKSDYNIVEDRDELEGIKVGQRVRAIRDNEDEGYYSGDEGLVLGVSVTAPGIFNPTGKTDLTVAFDGMDPISAKPEDLDPVE